LEIESSKHQQQRPVIVATTAANVLRVHFDTCINGAAISIRPLPKHCLQGGGNILRSGWTGCLTLGNPVPSHLGHSISLPASFGFSFFMKIHLLK
jgi:hypothetical protein